MFKSKRISKLKELAKRENIDRELEKLRADVSSCQSDIGMIKHYLGIESTLALSWFENNSLIRCHRELESNKFNAILRHLGCDFKTDMPAPLKLAAVKKKKGGKKNGK